MKEYFYSDGQEQLGPLKAEELKEKKINKDTLVWCEGMEDWQKAGDVEELKFLFVATPPPLKKVDSSLVIEPDKKKSSPPLKTKSNISSENPVPEKKKKKKAIMAIIIITSVFVLAFVIFLLFKDKFINNDSSTDSDNSSIEQPTKKSESELKAELLQTEQSNPTNYLTVSGTGRSNFWNEAVVEGDIYSSATLATFKDINISVEFLSKTDALLSIDEFMIYDFIKPGGKLHFKQKFGSYPSKTNNISFNVISVKVAE